MVESIDFTRSGFEKWLSQSPPVGTEVKSVSDRRQRAWFRTKGVALGYQLYNRGRPKRGVFGTLGELSLTEYRRCFQEKAAEIQINGIAPKAPRLSEFFDSAMIPYSKVHHKNQKTILKVFKQFSQELKRKRLDEIRASDVTAEIARQQEKGISNASVNRVRSLLSKMLNLALADGLIASNPVKFVKALKEVPKPSETIADRALKRYVELAWQVPNKVHGACLALTAVSGARIGEIRGIRVEDVASDHRSFIVRDTKNGDDRLIRVGEVGRKALKVALPLSTNEFLFSSDASETGYISYPRDAHAAIIKQMMAEGVAVDSFKIKDLRATAGSKIYEATGDIELARRQLGHKTLAVTVKHYVKPSEAHLNKAPQVIDEIVNEKRG